VEQVVDLMGKLNNKGSAIVTVLVITTFITIIGTTMLYISSQNYQQKQTDYQNKQSFYGAEEALDCFKALLVEDVGEACSAAYQDTMQNYAKLESDSGRRDYYQKAYTEYLVKLWEKRKKDSGGKLEDAVKNLIKDNVTIAVPSDEESTSEAKTAEDIANCIYGVYGYGLSQDGSQFVIKGVRSKYTSGNYTTFLYTDICLEVPAYDDIIAVGATTVKAEDAKIVALTDYVVYMNWRRSDYEDTESSGLEIAESSSSTSESESSSSAE
jgi:hypothetical protein